MAFAFQKARKRVRLFIVKEREKGLEIAEIVESLLLLLLFLLFLVDF